MFFWPKSCIVFNAVRAGTAYHKQHTAYTTVQVAGVWILSQGGYSTSPYWESSPGDEFLMYNIEKKAPHLMSSFQAWTVCSSNGDSWWMSQIYQKCWKQSRCAQGERLKGNQPNINRLGSHLCVDFTTVWLRLIFILQCGSGVHHLIHCLAGKAICIFHNMSNC